jgi:hypothetical protein
VGFVEASLDPCALLAARVLDAGTTDVDEETDAVTVRRVLGTKRHPKEHGENGVTHPIQLFRLAERVSMRETPEFGAIEYS